MTSPNNDEVEDKTHFGADESFVHTSSMILVSPPTTINVRLAFSENEEGVPGVETLCARVTENDDERLIGCMKSLVIDRHSRGFQTEFQQRMDVASAASGDLACDLFDRKGHLKQALINHSVRKGSGIWDEELEDGALMIIESIEVAGKMVRRGIAKEMLMSSSRRTEARELEVEWVFVCPRLRRSFKTLEVHHQNEDVAVSFWRACGFRRVGLTDWFCYSTDEDHASRFLPIGEDIDIPMDGNEIVDRGLDIGTNPYEGVKNEFPLHFAVTSLSSLALDAFLSKEIRTHPPNTSYWSNPDSKGNTFLHIAAIHGCSECIRWVRNNLGTALYQVRNNRGFTPLEFLREHLDDMRQMAQLGSYRLDVSNNFRGFPDEMIMCSFILQQKDATCLDGDIQRERYGCNCGQCLGGFMPPRMTLELMVHARILYDIHHQKGDDDEVYTEHINPSWLMDFEFNAFIPLAMMPRLKADRAWRIGYVEIFNYIATCLEDSTMPTQDSIILDENRAQINSQFAGKHSRAMALAFLETGGKLSDVMRILFGAAKYQNPETNEGLYTEAIDEEMEAIPECRNDLEPGFVAAMCGVEDMAPNFTFQ